MRRGGVWLLLGITALGEISVGRLTPATGDSLPAQPPPSPNAAALREIDRIKEESRQTLAAFLRREPTPAACKVGFQLARERPFIVALSPAAAQAGLRQGDLLKSLAGVPINGVDDVARATAAMAPALPAAVVVERKGQNISLSVHCVPEPEAWAAITRALEAAFNGDWETCQAAAVDIVRARGFATSNALGLRADCAIAQTALRERRQSGVPLAQIIYEWQQAEIQEKRYEPGGLEDLRSRVLATVTVLRHEGFTELANDLEEQLNTAVQRAAQEE